MLEMQRVKGCKVDTRETTENVKANPLLRIKKCKKGAGITEPQNTSQRREELLEVCKPR